MLPAKVSRGFTLIELIIVIAIIALMTGALIPSFLNYINNQNIRQAQEQLKSDLRSIQNKALTGTSSDLNVKYWGVQFFDGSKDYYFFGSTTTAVPPTQCPNGRDMATWLYYDKALGVTSGALVDINSTVGCIYFSNKDGSAYAVPNGAFYAESGALNGFYVLRVSYNSNTKSLGVNPAGLVKTKN